MHLLSDKEDEEDDDFEGEGGKKEKTRGRKVVDLKDRPLPPLLARVNGQIEVG